MARPALVAFGVLVSVAFSGCLGQKSEDDPYVPQGTVAEYKEGDEDLAALVNFMRGDLHSHQVECTTSSDEAIPWHFDGHAIYFDTLEAVLRSCSSQVAEQEASLELVSSWIEDGSWRQRLEDVRLNASKALVGAAIELSAWSPNDSVVANEAQAYLMQRHAQNEDIHGRNVLFNLEAYNQSQRPIDLYLVFLAEYGVWVEATLLGQWTGEDLGSGTCTASSADWRERALAAQAFFFQVWTEVNATAEPGDEDSLSTWRGRFTHEVWPSTSRFMERGWYPGVLWYDAMVHWTHGSLEEPPKLESYDQVVRDFELIVNRTGFNLVSAFFVDATTNYLRSVPGALDDWMWSTLHAFPSINWPIGDLCSN